MYHKIISKNLNSIITKIDKEKRIIAVVSEHFVERFYERFCLEERDFIINDFLPNKIKQNYCLLL